MMSTIRTSIHHARLTTTRKGDVANATARRHLSDHPSAAEALVATALWAARGQCARVVVG
jgi:hypothetical protein